MSREARQWAWENREIDDPLDLLILLNMADVADEFGGNCYPSHARLVRDCRSTERTIRRRLSLLVERGLIEVQRRASPKRPTTYRLVGVSEVSTEESPPDSTAANLAGVDSTAAKRRPNGGQTAATPLRETSEEVEGEGEVKPSRKGNPNPPWDAIVEVVGWSPTTKTEKTRVGKAVREVTEALVAESPERDWNPENVAKAIRARAGRYRAEWPTAELTPEALVKHWSKFGPGRAAPAVPGSAPPDREVVRELASRNAESEFRLYLRGFRSEVDLTMAEQWWAQARAEVDRKAAGA